MKVVNDELMDVMKSTVVIARFHLKSKKTRSIVKSKLSQQDLTIENHQGGSYGIANIHCIWWQDLAKHVRRQSPILDTWQD